jgi:hypothetical protein
MISACEKCKAPQNLLLQVQCSRQHSENGPVDCKIELLTAAKVGCPVMALLID